MKIALVVTVLNEQDTIDNLLTSIFSQTLKPDEVIIVDGGSSDRTVAKIKSQKLKIKNYNGNFKILKKKGNRSVGRNEAIRNTIGDIIVCSDAGNILDKHWVENIVRPFNNHKIDVVAGYYKGKPNTIFQKCLVPYVLVMEDKVDAKNFLPASRSMAFRKSIWEKIGGFPEEYSHNEDYVFARGLKKISAKITFAKDAIVYWTPRNSFKEAFIMFFRFAFGDTESRVLRTSVLLLFARYILGLYFIFLSLLYKSFLSISILLAAFIIYILWSIKKNYRYVKDKQAIKILPLLQLTADVSVLSGSILGLLKVITRFNCLLYLKQNKFLFFVVGVYVFILLSVIHWGVPNQDHPFPYHMDEWHQLHAVAATFQNGTPNTAGSANGTMFHFLMSGFYLIPFMLFRLVDPFQLTIDNYFMRERIFEILRLNTLLYGVLSVFVLYKISKFINISKKLTVALFTFTPIWLILSGYFKYDIALMFWIVLSVFFFLRFSKEPNNRNYILAAIPAGLTVAVKISAIPLFIVYIFSYFWFTKAKNRTYRFLLLGIGVFLGCIFIFGMPDTLFGKGNIYDYVHTNVITGPKDISNLQLNVHPFIYLFFYHYPKIFGHGLLLIFIISVIFWIYRFFKGSTKKNLDLYKIELFLFFSLVIFVISILPLQIYAAGNRSLVLLPFLTLIIGGALREILNIHRFNLWIKGLIILMIIIQLYESFAWIYIKRVKSPQEEASAWIVKNIPRNKTIGIENIPIYQYLPNIIEKEFYFNQYDVKQKNMYFYQVVNDKSSKLPSIIVVTNGDIENELLKQSLKKNLIKRIENEGFQKITTFSPDFYYIKLFVNEADYYLSGLAASPSTITIYRKY